MKLTLIVIAALIGGATAATAQSDTNGPAVPPGDGITVQGTNPEGQAYTPPGYNVGLNVYPDGFVADGQDYPVCTRQVVDRCVQTYTRWASRRSG